MAEGLVVSCPRCGRSNRLAYATLDKPARCGACRAEIEAPSPVAVDTDAALGQLVAEVPLPVLVDFWAGWCGPCVMMAPELERFTQGRRGRLLVVKANLDSDPGFSARHAIRSIPTLVLFRGGRELDRLSGALPAEGIEAFVHRALGARA